MAWYPGADKMELQPESDAQPAIRPTQMIVHSMAAPWTPRRLYEYWRDSTGLESHFGLGYDGTLAQYIGTETRADANAQANRRPDGTGAVSVETSSNTTSTDKWTAAQIEKLVALGVWLHRHHGVPLRICRSHSDPGYGHHRMFSQWSAGGTSCPGDARVKQFREVVFPRIVARATGKEEEDDMPEALGEFRTANITVKPATWTTLDIGGKDLITGARRYTVTVLLSITSALASGTTVQGRFYHLRKDNTRWLGGIIERVSTGGSSFLDFTHLGSIAADERLRFEVQVNPADGASMVIETARARGLYWK
ncbi:hypothetical protein GCM10027168_18050 [Streptomyces capparidis]